MTFSLRRLLIGAAAIGFVVVNPLHLQWTLPWLEGQLDGTAAGDFLRTNERTIVVAGAVYFTAAMLPVYYWMWSRRRRPAPQIVGPARATATEADAPIGASYRGPGGGKRAPRPARARRRRISR
ncbi:MAG: hypothetical protein O3B84_07590 [Chloroflexi bacterium]|nr:hypothetical protein [Chloroflexota bacterium]